MCKTELKTPQNKPPFSPKSAAAGAVPVSGNSNSIFPAAQNRKLRVILDSSLSILSLSNPLGKTAVSVFKILTYPQSVNISPSLLFPAIIIPALTCNRLLPSLGDSKLATVCSPFSTQHPAVSF